ncbi:hypothetical protein GCM10008018_38540 [Paenibacillus marchantiophytorum]|uniref:Uncharacterized protein n=1 Tax=Paenibacillus marchantiophytorum TaxID=1619310 RepID=A0ABQ1EVX8_9BACL|nr:hypothetical protein [Paenibacillus marchantiophytorum]GFZ88764.1 hypothetical protein GCM10008018_38540 [Paenibacillus marchantiophytorum]
MNVNKQPRHRFNPKDVEMEQEDGWSEKVIIIVSGLRYILQERRVGTS